VRTKARRGQDLLQAVCLLCEIDSRTRLLSALALLPCIVLQRKRPRRHLSPITLDHLAALPFQVCPADLLLQTSKKTSERILRRIRQLLSENDLPRLLVSLFLSAVDQCLPLELLLSNVRLHLSLPARSMCPRRRIWPVTRRFLPRPGLLAV
jgi:hypothetical protein